ncbi:hypothetical protein GCM10010464_40760 [Pseudonocardia yunnanensis]|uniref:Uncharacterized protein n=1 Tax=Pseudonocardia yunnanensis TaxID=58107 RepID=A0ABW4F5I6_9PSEU
MRAAASATLFAFLGPFGTALDRDQLCRTLLTRARRTPIEVLLHFSVSTVARIGGLVRNAHRGNQRLTVAERKTVANVDRFLGGDWWHEPFRAISGIQDEGAATKAAMDVADRYCRDVGAQTGFHPVAFPVRPAPGRLPKYVLVLSPDHQQRRKVRLRRSSTWLARGASPCRLPSSPTRRLGRSRAGSAAAW